jgi:hypothetical protein
MALRKDAIGSLNSSISTFYLASTEGAPSTKKSERHKVSFNIALYFQLMGEKKLYAFFVRDGAKFAP